MIKKKKIQKSMKMNLVNFFKGIVYFQKYFKMSNSVSKQLQRNFI